MLTSPFVSFSWHTSAATVTPATTSRLADCWWEVANAGGAVGFPGPVDISAVRAEVEKLLDGLHPQTSHLLTGEGNGFLGWLMLGPRSHHRRGPPR
jgi:hypothetical protein